MSRPRISKEWLDAYFEYGVDPIRRRVWLHGDITEKDVGYVLRGLYALDEEAHTPIELFISSVGGEMYEMFALYDVIRLISSTVETVAIGKCMSAAPLLVAAGTLGKRYTMPNTWFMVHQGTLNLGDDSIRQETIETDLAHLKAMNDQWCSLMGKHTTKPKSWWKLKCRKVADSYISAEEAVEIGLVDGIWLPNKESPTS